MQVIYRGCALRGSEGSGEKKKNAKRECEIKSCVHENVTYMRMSDEE